MRRGFALSKAFALASASDQAREIRDEDVRAARRRSEDEALSQDEIAFYDALAENESAVDLVGNNSLKVIAHELLESLKGDVTVDWSRRESARANGQAGFFESMAVRPIFKTRPSKQFSGKPKALSSKWAI
jgi:type I site-specific restriction-modification system R (restriction) subunit